MYLDKISTFVKQQLVWWEEQIHHHNDLEEYELLQTEKSDTIVHSVVRKDNGAEQEEANGKAAGDDLDLKDENEIVAELKPDDIQNAPRQRRTKRYFQKARNQTERPRYFYRYAQYIILFLPDVFANTHA